MPWVILLFALFASIFTFSKLALLYSEPFFLIGSRMTFAGILLFGYTWLFNRESIKIRAEHVRDICLLAFFAIYLTNIAEIWGIKHMDSGKCCLLYSLSPFLAALVAYIVLKEKLNFKKWIGMIIGFIGLIPIAFSKSEAENLIGQLFIFSYAELSMVLAVISSVYGWILLKKLVQQWDYSPILANGLAMLIGGTLALCHSYISGETWNPIPVNSFGHFASYSILMCLISNVICYNLYGYLLKRYSATFMSFAGLITPFFASLFGWMSLNEQITWHYFASITLFSIGLAIFYQEELKSESMRIDGKNLETAT